MFGTHDAYISGERVHEGLRAEVQAAGGLSAVDTEFSILQYRDIADGSHAVVLEHPKVVMEEVTSFIRGFYGESSMMKPSIKGE